MKRSLFLGLAAAVMACGVVHAIPQTVGGLFTNGSNNPGRLPLEEWFRDARHWEADAKVPGAWISGIKPGSLMMREPGAVFGLNASMAVVNRDDTKGAIETVQVYFDADTAKVSKSDLRKRLDKAVALFTGPDGKAAGYTVTLTEPNAGAVTATLKR